MRTPNSELPWKPASPDPSSAGGCDFAVDPTLQAHKTEVFWLPDWRPSVVTLVACPIPADTLTFSPGAWPGLRARHIAKDGQHLLLGAVPEEYQLWLPEPAAEGQRIAAVIPLDEFAAHRSDAMLQFLRHVKGRKTPTAPKANRRFISMLRALDGHLAGCSYRVIADVFFGRARVASEPWKTSSLRDAAIRLVRNGVALMRGGYRKLLRR